MKGVFPEWTIRWRGSLSDSRPWLYLEQGKMINANCKSQNATAVFGAIIHFFILRSSVQQDHPAT
jgi:hypothetical protein